MRFILYVVSSSDTAGRTIAHVPAVALIAMVAARLRGHAPSADAWTVEARMRAHLRRLRARRLLVRKN